MHHKHSTPLTQQAFNTGHTTILQGEYYASALSNVYTFGPTFRAEYSFTSRHLAEFWMIEPEIAFCNLEDDMTCTEDYVRYCCRFLLDNCRCVDVFLCTFVMPLPLLKHSSRAHAMNV